MENIDKIYACDSEIFFKCNVYSTFYLSLSLFLFMSLSGPVSFLVLSLSLSLFISLSLSLSLCLAKCLFVYYYFNSIIHEREHSPCFQRSSQTLVCRSVYIIYLMEHYIPNSVKMSAALRSTLIICIHVRGSTCARFNTRYCSTSTSWRRRGLKRVPRSDLDELI